MTLRDDLEHALDALLPKKKIPAPARGTRRDQPRLAAGTRDALADATPDFGTPILFLPPERPNASATLEGGAAYLNLPPHVQPSSTAKPWYERRALAVEPGQSVFILDYAVDTESTVYWAHVGTDQHLNSFYEWWQDGTIFEPITGAAQVGTVLSPYRFPAAVRIDKSLRLRVYNYNAVPFTYEAVVAGWIEPKL